MLFFHTAKSTMHRAVLLIDDSTATFERCRGALGEIRDAVYSLAHAPSGNEGLALIESNHPDCVLIGWSLPGKGAAAALNRIHTRFPHMPVIMLMDADDSASEFEEMQGLADRHMLKSAITASTLHSAIDSAIHDAEARKTSARIAALSRTVLIIDDNPDDQELCARALRQADERYRIFEAGGGNAGLELIEQERPDCVLLDYSLPGVTGLDVLRRIHFIDAFLPVIMMTGQGREEIAVQAMKSGAQNYLVKSAITPALLHQAILSAVEHAELERQINEQRQQIYEQKLALAETSRLTMAILDNAPCMIVATDKDGKVLVFNKELERVLGYQAHEVVGKHTPQLWSPQSPILNRAKTIARRGLNGAGGEIATGSERAYAEEKTFVRKDGSEVPVSLWVRELYSSEGQVVGFVGLGEDITERKRQMDALKTSEETFRSAMENAPCGMALIAMDGDFLQVNAVLCEMLGYHEAELRATSLEALTHAEDVALDTAHLTRLEAGAIATYTVEKRLIHKAGTEIEAQINVSLVRDAENRPQYYVTQIQDVSERKEIERMKRDFISIVSHELRTPITSIRGSLGLLTSGLLLERPEMASRLIDIAHKNCERLILIVNDILDSDRMAAGQMRFEMKTAPLDMLVKDAISANRGYLGNYKVGLTLQPIPADITVTVDPTRFLQVLSNLISNAAKFSPPGGQIQIAVIRDGKDARVCVTDSGPGIPENFRARLFEKFSQLDTSSTRKLGGSGLGLHISKQLIEHMGGRIGVDSAEGLGSTFWIALPADTEDAVPMSLTVH
jgi:PAS domain S-box-containing protein